MVTHEPGRCAGCGTGLFGAEVTGTGRRQVIDLPGEIRALVTEHRIVSRRCGCGMLASGTVPAGVSAAVQYGPRLSAAAAYLWHGQFLSRDWATQAADALRDLERLADASLAIDGTLGHIDQVRMAGIRHRYHSALLIGTNQTAARAGPLMRKHHALARRLLTREDDYLRSTSDPLAPFDKNAAEREVRMGKLRIKVSGCLRSMAGAGAFCTIRSYLSTAAKHNIGKLGALTLAAAGTPWLPETT
ncbi:MAG: IS66 family transposase [Streptosporangiaceae bacterium]